MRTLAALVILPYLHHADHVTEHLESADDILSLASQERNEWSPLTKTLLGMSGQEAITDDSTCLNHPDHTELARWGDALSEASAHLKFKKKLDPFFQRLKEQGTFDLSPDELTERLKHTSELLEKVCTSHLAEG